LANKKTGKILQVALQDRMRKKKEAYQLVYGVGKSKVKAA
jgi:hypothetical protein